MKINRNAQLSDSYGRRIRKLRVSLLDACNYRCFYCMPLRPVFMNSESWMSPEEIEEICSVLAGFGVEEIRITGGEPTLRKEFREIVSRLSSLPVRKLGLTTNGWNLSRELGFLETTRCRYLNISMDSLSEKTFWRITRGGKLESVMESVIDAKRYGFRVKINTVVMRGINDHELRDFVEFSAVNGVEVRFLELMSIGQVSEEKDRLFVPATEMIKTISAFDELVQEKTECDSTSFNYTTRSGARIGFIASETFPFCASCSRWRLTADGFLRACLMSENGVKIRGVEPGDYMTELRKLLDMKPYRRISHLEQDMYRIGG